MLQFVAALTVAAAASTQPAAPATATDAPALNWQSDYGKALAATRRDARPLLVVIDAPQHAQQSLGANVLAGAKTQNLLAKYDLCRVDATTPYGKQVADAFGAKQFPHVAIIDKSGAVVLHKQSGAATSEQFTATLAKHQSGQRAPVAQSAYYRGDATASSTPVSGVSMDAFNGGAVQSYPAMAIPGNCPSCQRQAMGY